MAKSRIIDDAGTELSFKRKGRKGKTDAKGVFTTWMTKKNFEKENPELIFDWKKYKDEGVPFRVVSLAHRYYKGIHALKSGNNNPDFIFDVNKDLNNEQSELLEQQIINYQEYLKDVYALIHNMIDEGRAISKEYRDFPQSENTMEFKKYQSSLYQRLKDVTKSYHDAFSYYGALNRNKSAFLYYVKTFNNGADILREFSNLYWNKIIAPSRKVRPKGDDDVFRPKIEVFSARYTGDVEIPEIPDEEWPAYMVKTFGLRGMEFGLWNDQGERLKFIHECYTGLIELSRAMEIKPEQVGFGGRLGLAIGARGRGNASAHFSAVSNDEGIINLTRTKGVGALAHEYGHALDFFAAPKHGHSKDFLTDTNMKNNDLACSIVEGFVPYSGSDNDAGLKTNGILNTQLYLDIVEDRVAEVQPLGQKASSELWGTISKMKYENGNNVWTTDAKRELQDKARVLIEFKSDSHSDSFDTTKFSKLRASMNDTLNKYGQSSPPNYDNEAFESIEDSINELMYSIQEAKVALYIAHTGIDTYKKELALTYSEGGKSESNHKRAVEVGQDPVRSWYSRSRSLDQGRSKKYWSTKKEMWARLFEFWVYHKMEKQGVIHDLLVSGVCNDNYQVNKCPYPTKEDGSMDNFYGAMEQVLIEQKTFNDAYTAKSLNIEENEDVELTMVA